MGKSRVDTYDEPLRLPTTNDILSHKVDIIVHKQRVHHLGDSFRRADYGKCRAANPAILHARACFQPTHEHDVEGQPVLRSSKDWIDSRKLRQIALKHRRVRFGNVAPSDDIGYLAVGSLSDDDDGVEKVGKVERNRLYR